MTSVTSTALQLKFVCVTSFLLLGQLRDLTHLKKGLLNSPLELYGEVLIMEFLISNISFEKFLLGLFPYRPYVS